LIRLEPLSEGTTKSSDDVLEDCAPTNDARTAQWDLMASLDELSGEVHARLRARAAAHTSAFRLISSSEAVCPRIRSLFTIKAAP